MHSNLIKQQESFVEEQTFSRKWNYFFIPLLLLIIYFYPIHSILLKGFTIGSLVPVLIVVILWALFIFMKLKIEISKTEIKYKFFPFHLQARSIKKNDIRQAEIKPLDAFSEFGGWGIRYNFGTKTTGYIISGNNGILIIKKTGKRTLISTTFPPEKLQPFLNPFNSEG